MARSPNPIDTHVGNRVRMRRLMLDMSQTALGDAVGISFQQIQKYEKGTNCISASRLQQISNILQVPVPFFFEGASAPAPARKAYNREAALSSETIFDDFLATGDGLSLCKAFMDIKSRHVRSTIVRLVEELARPAR